MSLEKLQFASSLEGIPSLEEISAAEQELRKAIDGLEFEQPIPLDIMDAFGDEPPKELKLKMEACTQGVLALCAAMPPGLFALKVQLTEIFSKVDVNTENFATAAGSVAGLLWIFGLTRIFAKENYEPTPEA